MFSFSKTAFAALIILGSVAAVFAAPVAQEQSGRSVRVQPQAVAPSVIPDEQPLDIAKGNIW